MSLDTRPLTIKVDGFSFNIYLVIEEEYDNICGVFIQSAIKKFSLKERENIMEIIYRHICYFLLNNQKLTFLRCVNVAEFIKSNDIIKYINTIGDENFFKNYIFMESEILDSSIDKIDERLFS